MKKFFWNNKYQLLLFAIITYLFYANYQPGTYLSGWDNLQTELNPALAVKRALFSVWEEYQSFGLPAGMAHAADLIRAIFLWVISFFLPQNMIRYFFHFLMLFVGALGMLKFLKSTLNKHNNAKLIAFLGSLFYALNLGTLQIFYLPFETFSAFFAFLPWAIWIFIKLLAPHNHSEVRPRRNILLFFLINLLGTPSFYAQQIFAVYMLILGCITVIYLIKQPRVENFKKIILLFVIIFVINSFWILPQIYFLKTNGYWVTQSKANQIATEETFYKNVEKGTIDNFLRLEGFFYDSRGMNNFPLFLPWQKHSTVPVKIISYLFAYLVILGIFDALQKKKYEFIFIFCMCALALLSATEPITWLNTLIRKNVFINQIFRSPFTKFIIPFSFIYSYFVAVGLKKLVDYFEEKKTKNLIFISFSILLFVYAYPAFQGFFISPELKVKIPTDYRQVISYFKKEDKNKRIALLPEYTFWGWFFHRWGYNGSGFMWYGIEQPIVSRTFDVWSPYSESYFWEQKNIIESEDLNKFESLLEKYNIDYLLLDYSLIPVVSSYKSLQYDRLENLISKSSKLSPVYKGNHLSLFKFNSSKPAVNFVSVSKDLENIGPDKNVVTDDQIYWENGYYKTDRQEPYTKYYPFLDLTTQTRILDKDWQIEEKEATFNLKFNLDPKIPSLNVNVPASYSAMLINQNNEPENFKLNLLRTFNNDKLNIEFEKKLINSQNVTNLDYDKDIAFDFPNLIQKYGYLLKIKSKNVKGVPLSFYIVDQTKKQPIIDEDLRSDTEYFIIPPKFEYGIGYSIIFQKSVFSKIPSENLIEELSVYLFPYQGLKQIKFNAQGINDKNTFATNFKSRKSNYYTYEVDLSGFEPGNYNVILNQAYDPGWVALNNGKVLNHFKINNWANGWKLDKVTENSNSNIIIFFWPQYLEFLGIFIAVAGFIWVLKSRKIN